MTDKEINEEVCKRLGIKISHLRNGKGNTNCPFHEDRSPSFSVDLNRGICHCFSCLYSSTLKSLYYDKTGHGIMRDLGIQPTGLNIFSSKINLNPISFDELPDTGVYIEGNIIPIEASSNAIEYLKKRGISLSIAKEMKMKFVINGITKDTSNLNDEKSWEYITNRILTPVYEKGKILSYELRDIMGEKYFREQLKKKGIDDSEIKYKKVLYPKHSSTNTLFQFEHLDTTKPLYFLEGLMDLGVLRSDSYFKNSTSVFGASIGQRQQYFLKKFSELIYIADHDKAGLISIQRLKEQIGIPFRYIFAPRGCKDVGDIPQKLGISVEECRNRKWLATMKNSDDFDIIKEAENSEFVSDEDLRILKQAYKKN